jgi:TorA maturation chaperone TorD
MSASVGSEERKAIALFREAVAEDLLALAVLHDRELDAERIEQLRATGFPGGLGLVLESAGALEAIDMMQAAVALLPQSGDSRGLDDLAADYADIYLTYKLRASPCESVWLDEDGLTLQQPMFEIRDWYRRHDLSAENWRERSDDHLVLQLQFIAHLLGSRQEEGMGEAARFLDKHLLRWIFDFASRVSTRCATPFYAGLAALTAAYADELRDLLAGILGEPRPDPELIQEDMLERREASGNAAGAPDIPVVSIPATTPSW